MEQQQNQWDYSYERKENYLFAPHEEVIRFVSKYVRRRVGLDQFETILPFKKEIRFLDLGCGIGRHLVWAQQMKLDSYGIDLSEVAVQMAREWAASEKITEPQRHILQGDVTQLPWPDRFFQVIVSHGVLDSMHFESALATIKEVARALSDEGLFYCDLVSGDDSAHGREFAEEEVINTRHEEGTIQSYFNYAKIKQLLTDHFSIVEGFLVKKENILQRGITTRYHLILKKPGK